MIARNAAARRYEEQRLKQLQDKDCPHSDETDWMEELVGPGAQHGPKGQGMRQLQQGDPGQKVLRWLRERIS
jgi:hypothetical protein